MEMGAPLDVRTIVDWEANMDWFANNPQALIYGDNVIEVKAEHITKMLTYGNHATNKSRWLTMDTIVAFGKTIQTKEKVVIANQDLINFLYNTI